MALSQYEKKKKGKLIIIGINNRRLWENQPASPDVVDIFKHIFWIWVSHTLNHNCILRKQNGYLAWELLDNFSDKTLKKIEE